MNYTKIPPLAHVLTFQYIPITFPRLSACLIFPWLSQNLKGYNQPGQGRVMPYSSSSPQEGGKEETPWGTHLQGLSPWETHFPELMNLGHSKNVQMGILISNIKWQVSPPISQMPMPMYEPISSGVMSSQSPCVFSMLGLWGPQKTDFFPHGCYQYQQS